MHSASHLYSTVLPLLSSYRQAFVPLACPLRWPQPLGHHYSHQSQTWPPAVHYGGDGIHW